MGDRGDVCVKDGKKRVYLYTHWSACDLPQIVKDALVKKWRWDDAPYLARIIFDEMTKDSHGEETGYGISTEPAGDGWRTVEVDVKEQTVRIIDNGTEEFDAKFEDYIKLDEFGEAKE